MKVSYMSDWHLDFWIRENNPESPKFQRQLETFLTMTWLQKGGDVLIIAGDLGHYFAQDSHVLLKIKQLFKHVILVRGNHDMYLVTKNQKSKYKLNSMNRVNQMKQFCKENDIHYLDGDIIEIDGIKFGGVGMSWDDSYYQKQTGEKPSRIKIEETFKTYMNDPKLIFGGADNYNVPLPYSGRYFKSNWDQLKYFNSEMNKLRNMPTVDVMISHYSPVFPLKIKSKYKSDPCTTFYFFDGREEVQKIGPKFWIFGHTHDKHDFVYNETRFLCNPLGYPSENTYTIVESFVI